MTGSLLITDVHPYGEKPVDLLIDGTVIAGVFDPALRPLVLAESHPERVVEGRGLVVLPAFIDLHTHLREPGGEAQETFQTGLASAAAGGYSDVFAMANTNPVTDSADRVRAVRERSAAASHVRTHPVGAITIGLEGEQLTPIEELAAAGVTVFSDDGRCVDDAGLVAEALRRAGALGLTIAQHAQSHALSGAGQINDGFAADRTRQRPWPVSGEAAIIARDAVLAAENGGHLHVCHLSTRRSVEVVRQAKALGWPVTAEVTPHHLLLTDELAAFGSPRFKVNPPLRSADDVRALREALHDGTIDAVATDHAPHTVASKNCGWGDAAFGMTGLETALAVVAYALQDAVHDSAATSRPQDAVDWRLIARVFHDAPARIGGLDQAAQSGIRAGDPATLTFIAEEPVTVDGTFHASKGTNTPFQGVKLPHTVRATVIDGEFVHGQL